MSELEPYLEDTRPTLDEVCKEYKECTEDCPAWKFCKAVERQLAIDEWLHTHCQTCIENIDRGTGFVNCQSECEVVKDIGAACIHYQEYVEESDEL